MDSLDLADLLEKLVKAEDPVSVVWAYLLQLWEVNSNREKYFREGERQTMYLERVLNAAYPEFYTEILPYHCTHDLLDVMALDAPLIWMDGLSLREAVLLKQDIPGVQELSYTFSTLPSETTFYREAVFERIPGKRREIKDVTSIFLDGDEDAIRCPLPDVELEEIRGRVKVRTLLDIYEDTKAALLTIFDELRSDSFLVTSDHGYINTETYFEEVGKRTGESLAHLFDSGRFAPCETLATDLVKQGYIILHEGYYLVRGRYAWPSRGKYKVMLHGGVSLLECLVPVLKVKL